MSLRHRTLVLVAGSCADIGYLAHTVRKVSLSGKNERHVHHEQGDTYPVDRD